MAQNETAQVIEKNGNTFGYITIFCRLVFVLLLRAGYLLVQFSFVPAESINIILLQNVIDIAIGIISFALFGYMIAYGPDVVYGIIGWHTYIDSSETNYDELIFGICTVLIGTAIISNITSGRKHLIGYLMTNIFYSGILLPLYMHWIWNKDGFLRTNHFSKYVVSAKDYAGGMVIHLSAGITGLIASLSLRRKIVTLHDTDKLTIGTESFKISILGYFFIIMGMISFSLPNPNYRIQYKNVYGELILVNNVLAITGSMIAVIFLSHVFFQKDPHYCMIQRCFKGSIAGIVSISTGIDIFSPITALAVATGGAVLFTLVCYLLKLRFAEGYCNSMISVHIICAFYSCTITALVARTENFGYSVKSITMLINLFWQLFMAACVLITTLVFMYLLHQFLQACGFLLNKNEILNYTQGKTEAHENDKLEMKCSCELYKTTSDLGQRSYGKSAKESNIKIDRDRTSLSVVAGNTVISEIENNQLNSFKTNSKSRIFTIQCSEPILENDDKFSCGDFESTRKKNTIKIDSIRQPQNISEENFHSNSGIRLHRTEKHTNLCRKIKNEKTKLQDDVKICFLPTEDDKKYGDGFITIKKPYTNL